MNNRKHMRRMRHTWCWQQWMTRRTKWVSENFRVACAINDRAKFSSEWRQIVAEYHREMV